MFGELLFIVLSLVILIAAIKMLNARELVHSAVWLGVVLTGVSGIYLIVGAEFLAAIQLLIYVGAVVTLLLFAIMFMTPASPTEGYGEDKTPLAVLGIRAPRGYDVEAMAEVPPSVATVQEAEATLPEATIEPADDESDDTGSDDEDSSTSDEDRSDEPDQGGAR